LGEDHWNKVEAPMTNAERIAGLEGQLKAQAGNAAEEARQNAAEIDGLRQRCAELERERDEAREEVERLTAVTPHTGKEIADLALKWAVAGWMSHSPEMITAERSKFEHHVLTTFCACARPYKDRAEAAEARLARMRAEALEEAARVAEQEVTTYHEGMSAVDVRLSHTRGPKWPDGPSIANAIRALASDTGTGGEQP
jgi:DNA repair exonuclease SbcCD ATPase subunit